MTTQDQLAVIRLTAALEQVWAAVGDRLLAQRPLSRPYANDVQRQVKVALQGGRAALDAHDAESAHRIAELEDELAASVQRCAQLEQELSSAVPSREGGPD